MHARPVHRFNRHCNGKCNQMVLRRVDCRGWDCRELLVTAPKLNCIASADENCSVVVVVVRMNTNKLERLSPSSMRRLKVKVVKLIHVLQFYSFNSKNSNLLLLQVILKANTVDVKLLWIRRMRQLIQVCVLTFWILDKDIKSKYSWLIMDPSIICIFFISVIYYFAGPGHLLMYFLTYSFDSRTWL